MKQNLSYEDVDRNSTTGWKPRTFNSSRNTGDHGTNRNVDGLGKFQYFATVKGIFVNEFISTHIFRLCKLKIAAAFLCCLFALFGLNCVYFL